METKEYVVILRKGFNYDEVWADIESPTSGLPHIPDRPVSIINDLNGLDRLCAYALTDEEAEKLRQDPRIEGVEIPIEKTPEVEIVPYTVQQLTPTPVIINKLMNWSQANGDLTLFVEGNSFTGWIGDITKANFLIDSNERLSIVNNASIRQELKKIGAILNTNVPDSSISSYLNSIVDAVNYQIDFFLGSKTQAICAAGQPAIYTTATSFIQDGKKYTRTTLRTSQINYGLNAAVSTLPPTNVLADAFIDAVVAANRLVLSNTQRAALKSALIVVFELILGIVRTVTDDIDLYDYTVQMEPITLNFNKPANGSIGPNINWGLIRHTNSSNVYNIYKGTTNLNYSYELDGTNVDVVISDTGIQADHPEFTDVNGVSRIQQINWASYVPALSSMTNPYQDTIGHGTHVAGIVVGKTYGWAKNARIYAIPAAVTGAPSVLDQVRAIKLWHLSKNGSRPTVVNMSWGLGYNWTSLGGLPSTTQETRANVALAMNNFLNSISGGSYRGETYLGNTSLIGSATNTAPKGLLIDSSYFIDSFRAGIPAQSLQVTTALEDLISAGVVVVHAAGNSSYKIDKPMSHGGTGDYDNYITYNNNNRIYYNRGSSPQSDLSICVGNLDSSTYNFQEKKANSSCAGPGVDIYAAGTNIMSSTTSDKNATKYSLSGPYSLNVDFRQLNISGTSMASPQVAGMCALYLQRHPTATPAEVKKWIEDSATPNIFHSYYDEVFSFQTLLGGQPRVAYQNLQGSSLTYSHIKDNTNTWRQTKAVWVKYTDGTWKQAKSGWQKNNAGAWVKIYES